MTKTLTINWFCDGWKVYDGDEVIGEWDINDEDLGVKGLTSILESFGYNVEVVEVY